MHHPTFQTRKQKHADAVKLQVTQDQTRIKNAIIAANPRTTTELGISTPTDAPPSNVIDEGEAEGQAEAEAEGTPKDEDEAIVFRPLPLGYPLPCAPTPVGAGAGSDTGTDTYIDAGPCECAPASALEDETGIALW